MALILTTDNTPRDVFLRAEQAVISPDKEEQIKSVSYTENGDYQVTPDAGKTLSKVNINVDVPQEPLAPLDNPATKELVIAGKEYYDDQKVAHTGALNTLESASLSSTDVLGGHLMARIVNGLDGAERTFAVAEAPNGTEYQPSLTDQSTPDGIYQATPNVFKAITKERLAELDADFAAENIKKDVDIFGLVGTYDPTTPLPVIEPLSVTQNGTYTAPAGTDGYNPVTVNVPGVQKYTGTITPATDTRPISVTVPKSSVAKPQDIVIVADVADIASVQTYSTLKAGGQRALVTDFANDLNNINEMNGLLAFLRTATSVQFSAATVTFSDAATETVVTVTPPSAYYFRSAITYKFTVFGWEDTP